MFSPLDSTSRTHYRGSVEYQCLNYGTTGGCGRDAAVTPHSILGRLVAKKKFLDKEIKTNQFL